MPISLNSPAPVRRRLPLLLTAAVLAVIFLGVFAWHSARQAAAAIPYAPPPVEVAALTVQAEELPQSVEAIGSLQAVQEVTLAPEVAGRVVAIRFEAGAAAAKGTPLVELYDAPERADRAAAVSRAGFAEQQYQRSRALAPTGAESQEILQQRESELSQTRAAVEQLDARITQKTVRAPFDGSIGIRRVNLGQYVNAGDPLATLTALDPLYVNFTLPQQDLARLHLGGSVTVRTDAFPGRSFTARINAIEPVIGADTRNVSVQATLANPDKQLRPGLYVTAGLQLPSRPDAIVVPVTAIQTTASGDTAYLVRGDKAEIVPVLTGQRIGDRIVVESGLKPGDIVITAGQLRVQPGAAVKVVASGDKV